MVYVTMNPVDPQKTGVQPAVPPDHIQLVPEVLFTLMALGCIAIGWAYIWPGYLDHLYRDEFLSTPCHVVESRVRRASDDIDWTYDLRYDYVIDGITYQSDRLDFASGTSTHSPPALPPPGPSICYVRTGDPTKSVLYKRIDPATGPIGLAVIGVCALFAWSAFQFRRMRLRNRTRVA